MKNDKNNKKFSKENFVPTLETPLLDSYDVIYEMGSGAYSKVYEVKHKISGQIRACKYIKKKDFKKEDIERFKKEIEILKKSVDPFQVAGVLQGGDAEWLLVYEVYVPFGGAGVLVLGKGIGIVVPQ